MICKKCGYNYSDEEEKCPFCGADKNIVIEKLPRNEKKVVEVKKEIYKQEYVNYKDNNEQSSENIEFDNLGIRDPLYAVFGICLYFAFQFIASIIITIIVLLNISMSEAQSSIVESVVSITVQIGLIVGACVVFRKHIKEIILKVKSKHTWKWVGISLAIIFGLSYIYSIIITAFGWDQTGANQEGVNEMIFDTPFIGLIYVCILAPIFEEMVFRLGIFRSLVKKNKYLAFVITTIIFAGMHMIASITEGSFVEDLVVFPSYLIGAFALTFCYYKSKSIMGSILAHSIYNTYGYIMILLSSLITVAG